MIKVYEHYDEIYDTGYDVVERWGKREIQLTGCWKIVKTDAVSWLYLEKISGRTLLQKRFLREWVPEERLSIVDEQVYINECGG